MVEARVDSEIGRLRHVVIHTPGPEIESMTPRTAHQVLYNDIIPISVVSDEHRTLKAFLATVATVHETRDLLVSALETPGVREQLVNAVCVASGAGRRVPELLDLAPRDLAAAFVSGLRGRGDTLTEVLAGTEYDLPPLPNLYFMRDSSFVIGDRVAIGAMAHDVRSAEAMLLRAIFTSATGVANAGVLYDGCSERRGKADVRLEGGDVLVARPDLVVVGVSERTSSAALDALAGRLLEATRRPFTLIAVVLPRERSTIHLDMIFTLVDTHTAVVYEPLVLDGARVPTYRMRLEPGRPTVITRTEGLLPALRAEGLDLSTVACGGTDPVIREREQWLSAANVFAFAPGKVIGYDCNVATMDSFAAAGFAVRPVQEYLDGDRSVDDDVRLFVGMPGVNLARGGGGPRCMTLPVARDPFEGAPVA